MKFRYRCARIAALLVSLLPGLVAAAPVFGLTAAAPQRLIRFDSAAPGVLQLDQPITGLSAGVLLVGIDLRPDDGHLYGLGDDGRLYHLDRASAVATQVGPSAGNALIGAEFGFDFDPAGFLERALVLSDQEQNIRLFPDSGDLASTGQPLTYATTGDPALGLDPNIVATAYTSNFAGTISRRCFLLDSGTDSLVSTSAFSAHLLRTVGPLGIDIGAVAGFDVLSYRDADTSVDVAFAALSTDGTGSALYTIDLMSGTASLVGGIGADPTLLRGLTVEPPGTFRFASDNAVVAANEADTEASIAIRRVGGADGEVSAELVACCGSLPIDQYSPETQIVPFASGETERIATLDLRGDDGVWRVNRTVNLFLKPADGGASIHSGLSGATLVVSDDEAPDAWVVTASNRLLRINLGQADVVLSDLAITGLVGDESLVGLDVSPVDKSLLALGNAGRLYRVNPSNGAAQQVGDGQLPLGDIDPGVDVDPTTVRLRILGSDGSDWTVDPETGDAALGQFTPSYVDGDAGFGTTPLIAAVAFSNSVAGSTATTLYAYDTARNALVAEVSPGSSTLRTVYELGSTATGPVSIDMASRTTGAGHDFAVVGLHHSHLPGSGQIVLVDLTSGETGNHGFLQGMLITGIAVDDPSLFQGSFE